MLLRQRPNDPDFAMNLIYFFLSIQCLTKAMVAPLSSCVVPSNGGPCIFAYSHRI